MCTKRGSNKENGEQSKNQRVHHMNFSKDLRRGRDAAWLTFCLPNRNTSQLFTTNTKHLVKIVLGFKHTARATMNHSFFYRGKLYLTPPHSRVRSDRSSCAFVLNIQQSANDLFLLNALAEHELHRYDLLGVYNIGGFFPHKTRVDRIPVTILDICLGGIQ